MKLQGYMKRAFALGVLSLVSVSGASSEPYAFTGSRASEMGGANAASVNDTSAQWHNPAAFGFFARENASSNSVDNGQFSDKDFGVDLFTFGFGYALTEDMGRYLDILSDIDFAAFDSGTLSGNPDNVNALLAMAGVIGSADSEDALYVDFNAGTGIRIGSLGIGFRVFGEGAAWTSPDLDNLALNDYGSVNDFVDEIDAAASNEGFSWDGSYVLSDQQRDDLAASLGVANNSATIQYLDDQFGEALAAGTLTPSELVAAIDVFGNIVPGGSGNIDDNTSAVIGRAFSLVEVPVSYGWAINDNLSIGATAKAMYGSVLGTKIWLFDENNEEVLDEASDHSESSLSFGLDLGALYRIDNFQFAVVGHNLNRPTFDGFTEEISYTITGGATQTETITVPDVKIDPQVVLGAAWMPTKRLTLEASYDLLETGTILPGYDLQRLSFGGEVDVWVLAVRLGVYRNLAESWQDWVATAGIGANILGVRADIGGAISLGEDVEYDGNDVPAEARLFAGIGLDF